MDNCIFCKIVEGTAPAYCIHKDEHSLCILDTQPYAAGHCLVIPWRHVPFWHELEEHEVASLFKVAQEVSERIMREYKPDFVSLFARGRRLVDYESPAMYVPFMASCLYADPKSAPLPLDKIMKSFNAQTGCFVSRQAYYENCWAFFGLILPELTKPLP
jgi:hypothetical protein